MPTHRASTPQPPALEPTPCDTAPMPFTSLNLDSRLLEADRLPSGTRTQF